MFRFVDVRHLVTIEGIGSTGHLLDVMGPEALTYRVAYAALSAGNTAFTRPGPQTDLFD
jgi:hypothetical protein